MARQCGDALFYGTSGWANGYVGPDGRGVVRWKSPGMTKQELRNGKSELRRMWTGNFGVASRLVQDWWRWVPKELRALADRYASQRMIGMMMPSGDYTGFAPQILTGMSLSRDAVWGSGLEIEVLGEERDFHSWSRKLPAGFVVRGMEGLEGCFPKVKPGKLRARVLVHVGCLGQQVQWDAAGKPLGAVDYRPVTGWVGLEEVAALGKVRLDWKRILRGRKEGDVVVLLGIEVGYVRGNRVVRLKCASRLWVAWAGALERVPRRRVNRGVRRVHVPDRGAVRGGGVRVGVEVRGRDGPLV